MTKEGSEKQQPPGKVVQAFSLALVVLRNRKWRRNVIFGVTLLTLFLVFAGVTMLGDKLLENSPVAYLVYWGICFFLVVVILGLAILDLLIIRKEHRLRLKILEHQLAEAAREAREKAAAGEEKMDEDGGQAEN